MFKKISLAALLLILSGCATNNSSVNRIKNAAVYTGDKKVYNSIYQALTVNDIDKADDYYIKLKTDYSSSNYLYPAAMSLAVVHMHINENIIANFYLQEALQANPGSDFAKFLLVKNQFLAAAKNRRDQSYLNKALKALEVNKNIVTAEDDIVAAESMLYRVKIDKAYTDKEIGDLYKRMNKEEAYRKYQQKFMELGVDINEVAKQ